MVGAVKDRGVNSGWGVPSPASRKQDMNSVFSSVTGGSETIPKSRAGSSSSYQRRNSFREEFQMSKMGHRRDFSASSGSQSWEPRAGQGWRGNTDQGNPSAAQL